MSQRITKPTKWYVRPAKNQISLGPPSLIKDFAVRIKKTWVLSYPLSASEDSDQAGRMPRLICLRWAHMPFCWICRALTHLCISVSRYKNIG